MRSALALALFGSMTLAAAGCRPSIEVRTIAAPDAGLSQLHTFRMLPGPARRDGRPTTGADDPMISNSIANRSIREQIVKAFQGRGYTIDQRHPDFAVAFYAAAREKLDVNQWDYGYPFMPGWPRYPRPVQSITSYTEGSVVVDVVDATSQRLLWRGEGKAELSNDLSENIKQLTRVAEIIVSKFPSATEHVVAARP